FIQPDTFRDRMAYLARKGYPVLGLDEAIQRLDRGDLPPGATVITFDDGWHSIQRLALPVLKQLGFPATVYATTYYVTKQTPIFRLVVQYMMWKTEAKQLDVSDLSIEAASPIDLTDPAARHDAMWQIITHAEKNLTEDQRVALSRELGQRLGVDYGLVADWRLFSLMTPDELRDAAAEGLDIQLHTHRHVLPEDKEGLLRELGDNRAALEPLVGRPLDHFCYPDGTYSPRHFALLREAGIQSATTCDSSLNTPSTERMALHRFVDGSTIAPIEFEAEMCGFAHLLRRLRSCLLGRRERGRP
ncbi:polysaccharide deacetylase family protein, partial [bacterium]|nr:polysaccharide deacetylase family protein [bacterium]